MTNDKRNHNRRKPQDAQPALDPARARRFVWAEGDIIITPGKWSLGYSLAPDHTALVVDMTGLVRHILQHRPDQPVDEALREIATSPAARFAPEPLKSQLREAGLLPEEELP